MNKWKQEALQEYQKECFKQTRPYQYEIAYMDSQAGGDGNSNPPTCVSGTVIQFPDSQRNVLNFEGINSEYIVFVKKDGVPEKDAVELLLNQGYGADIIYSDEDFIINENADLLDINSKIRNLRTPWRKPDYSPDTLLSFPYVETFFAIKTVFARSVPVLKESAEISDNVRIWDFLLRAFERTGRVAHVEQVLYHRFLSHLFPGRSELGDVRDEEIYSALYEKYSQPEYRICREAAEVRRGTNQIPMAEPGNVLVSIIIPSKDNPELLKECIRNIRINAGKVPYELVVVDNGSNPDNKKIIEEFLSEMPEGLSNYLYEEEEFNFSKMCNRGAENAKGDYLLFLNDDVDAVSDDFLSKMLCYASKEYIGAVGTKLLYPESDRIQHVGVTDINKGPTHKLMTLSDEKIHYFGRNRYVWNVLAVTAACLMVEKGKYFQVGGFSDIMKVGYNDVDLCVKLIENGYFNVVNNECPMIHHESVSRGHDSASSEKMMRLKQERNAFYEAHPWLKEHRDPYNNRYLDADTIEFKSWIVPDYQVTDFRNKILALDKLPARPSDKVKMSIDRVYRQSSIGNETEDAYVFEGWGIHLKKDNALFKKYLIFIPLDEDGKEEKGGLIATVSPKYREDIKKVFEKAVNVYLAGFECAIPVSELTEGKQYRIGVCLHKKGGLRKYQIVLGDIYEPGRGIITEN